jgi:hypothetical protein|tara:strand:- start:9675 stop:10685 length:1011 start_codon:yes stop_codon:yes gene_type:complete
MYIQFIKWQIIKLFINMKDVLKKWQNYLTSVKIDEAETVSLPNVRMTSPDLGSPGSRPDPLKWRDHLKRQYPKEFKKLNDELISRLSKNPGIGSEFRSSSPGTKSKLIKNNIIEYWNQAMQGIETGAPIIHPEGGRFPTDRGQKFKPWPKPEDLPAGQSPAPSQSPKGRPGAKMVYDYPAPTIDPVTGKASPPEGFKEPFPKKTPKKTPKISALKTLGGATVAALATVDGVDALAGPEIRKAIATLTGTSKKEIAQISTPNLKQRLKKLISSYTAPFEMGVDFVRSKLLPTEQEQRAAQFKQKIKDTEAAQRWARLAGYEQTGGDVSGTVRGKKRP